MIMEKKRNAWKAWQQERTIPVIIVSGLFMDFTAAYCKASIDPNHLVRV